MNARISALGLTAALIGLLAWQWPEIQRYLKVRRM
jgi:hypothetical protein